MFCQGEIERDLAPLQGEGEVGISPRDAPFIRALSSPFSSFSSPSFGRRKEAYNRVIFWQDPYLSGLQCFEDGIEEEESKNWKVEVVQTFFFIQSIF